MIQIQILNKKRGGVGEYVGRPSPLGNPFPLRDEGEREAVVARFRAHLEGRLATGDPAIRAELNRLYGQAVREGTLRLVCWCSPRRCHAEVVAEVLIRALRARGHAAMVQYK